MGSAQAVVEGEADGGGAGGDVEFGVDVVRWALIVRGLRKRRVGDLRVRQARPRRGGGPRPRARRARRDRQAARPLTSVEAGREGVGAGEGRLAPSGAQMARTSSSSVARFRALARRRMEFREREEGQGALVGRGAGVGEREGCVEVARWHRRSAPRRCRVRRAGGGRRAGRAAGAARWRGRGRARRARVPARIARRAVIPRPEQPAPRTGRAPRRSTPASGHARRAMPWRLAGRPRRGRARRRPAARSPRHRRARPSPARSRRPRAAPPAPPTTRARSSPRSRATVARCRERHHPVVDQPARSPLTADAMRSASAHSPSSTSREQAHETRRDGGRNAAARPRPLRFRPLRQPPPPRDVLRPVRQRDQLEFEPHASGRRRHDDPHGGIASWAMAKHRRRLIRHPQQRRRSWRGPRSPPSGSASPSRRRSAASSGDEPFAQRPHLGERPDVGAPHHHRPAPVGQLRRGADHRGYAAMKCARSASDSAASAVGARLHLRYAARHVAREAVRACRTGAGEGGERPVVRDPRQRRPPRPRRPAPSRHR